MKFHHAALLTGLLSTTTAATQAITLNFDYSLDETGFFSLGSTDGVAARSILEAAGSYFSNLLNDTFDAVTFQTDVSLPSSSNTTNLSVHSAQDALTIYVGGIALGGNTLGQGGSVWFQNGNRGETGHSGNAAIATDFAPIYGRMSFDSDRSNWYFDNDVSSDEAFTGFDFYTVALHEIGHVLGSGIAPSFQRLVSGNSFTGANSVAVNGGNVDLYQDNAHFEVGLTSTIAGLGSFEVAMDPNIANGQRKHFTDLDIASLQDIGWEINVSAVPVPAAVWLFGSALIGLMGMRRRKPTSE